MNGKATQGEESQTVHPTPAPAAAGWPPSLALLSPPLCALLSPPLCAVRSLSMLLDRLLMVPPYDSTIVLAGQPSRRETCRPRIPTSARPRGGPALVSPGCRGGSVVADGRGCSSRTTPPATALTATMHRYLLRRRVRTRTA